MSEQFFGLQERAVRSFGQQARLALSRGDVAYWSQLLDLLSKVRRTARLSDDGRLQLDDLAAHPLTDFAWHMPPDRDHPALSPQVVPPIESEDLQWVLMCAVLLASEARVAIGWARFGYVWTDSIADEGLIGSTADREEVDTICRLLFEDPPPLPEELWFLSAASHLRAYLPANEVEQLAALEEQVGFMARLERHYRGSEDAITVSLGREIGKLRHFVAASALDRRAVFMCYRAL